MSRAIRSTTVKATSSVLKARRSSSPLLDDVPTRPHKRARKQKPEEVAEESQVTLVAKEVSSLAIESQNTLVEETTTTKIVVKKPRKKAAQGEPSPADFPSRPNCEWRIGAHISAAGGIQHAIPNAAKIGAESFALFLKNQKQWSSKPLESSSINAFKSRMETFSYDYKHVLPHGSYLVNLGNPDKEKREKSYGCFLDDLQRCEQTGIGLYNFHPGSTVGQCTIEESIAHVADSLNRAHEATSSVVTVVENMAGSGNVLGCTFEQLSQIIAQVRDKTRVGICLDTCHLFASGYDIRTRETYDETMNQFGKSVGFQYLRGLHLNDSKTPLGSKKDRHENIGLGHIGLKAFGFMMRDERLKGLPMVLETPVEEVWAKEIEVLQRMTDTSVPEDELDFDGMKAEIEAEVKKYAKEPVKKEKKAKPAAKGKGKKAKKVDEDEDSAQSDDDD